jgi:hypothetical protein
MTFSAIQARWFVLSWCSGAAQEVPMPKALQEVTMRPYQREGLCWLAFLRRSGLHGVLADDMVRRLTYQTDPSE